MRFSITKKFVVAFLLVSILPIAVLGFYTSHHLWQIGQRAIDSSSAELERRGRESIELRAVELANRVSQFLQSSEADLLSLKMLPREAEAYRRFSQAHRATIWTLAGSNDNPVEVHLPLPIYREVALVGPDGRERVRIADDRIVTPAELRDVSDPRNTTFKNERYFAETCKLRDGEIFVSHVAGWYASEQERLLWAERTDDAAMIQGALQEIDRLENLIHDILDFAAPSRRVRLLARSVEEVLQTTLFLVRKQCENQNIHLEVRAEAGVPPVNLDPERLQQALLNLLLNAIQAMPDGGTLSLRVSLTNSGDSLLSGPAVRIEVHDTGKGIRTEDLPYVFDPFFTRNPGGVGLGLAIVHSIVEEHGGRIVVSSQVGEGATFWMDLPVVDGPRIPQASADPASPVDS